MTLAENSTFNLKAFFRTVFTIALPIALQNLLNTTASMVDTIMIGSNGELAVAAVGICAQIPAVGVVVYTKADSCKRSTVDVCSIHIYLVALYHLFVLADEETVAVFCVFGLVPCCNRVERQ